MTPPRAHGPAETALLSRAVRLGLVALAGLHGGTLALLSRALRLGLVALAALAVLYGGTLALLSRPSVEARLRARIEAALRARLGDVTVGPGVQVDPLFRVSFGPVTMPGLDPHDPPTLRIERVRVRVRLLALLAGRVELASVRLLGVRVVAGSGGEGLRALAARFRRTPQPTPSAALARTAFTPEPDEPEGALPALRLKRLVVVLPGFGGDIEVGPLDLALSRRREARGEVYSADIAFPSGGRGSVEVVRDAAGWHGRGRLADLGPEDLPAALRARGAVIAGGRVSGEASADAAPDLKRAEGRGRLGAEGVYVAGERVAAGPEPIGPLSFAAEGGFRWTGAERRLRLEGGRVTLQGALPLAVSGEARLGPGVPFSLSVRAEGVEFAALVAALPTALAPPLEAPPAAGPFDGRLDLGGPLLAPGAWTIDAGLELSRMRESARRAPPVALRAPFVHRPEVETGRPPTIAVGPQSPDFVPIAELPVHVVRAVTTSEDAGFFAHEGFDFEELKNAFAQGAEAGRVVRGGSTITQQLAKNLFLTREKTLARKIREAVLTVALEATVPKGRLLEIYLNVAEWGPGIWGLGPAARHWFGKDARALTPKEAAFLASVIPNPVRYHAMWNRGVPGEAWEQRVHELLLKMAEQGAITEEELVTALDAPLVFARPDAVARP